MFFAALKRAGAELDEIIQDSEKGAFATSVIADNFGNTAAGHTCGVARWTAIQNDRRFPRVLVELQRRGFVVVDNSRPHYLAEALELMVKDQNVSRDQFRNALVWNAFMVERAAGYWQSAIYEPARRSFPGVMASNFDPYWKWTSDYCVPDQSSNMYCLAEANSTGAVVGGDGHGGSISRRASSSCPF